MSWRSLGVGQVPALAGLGLRRAFLNDLIAADAQVVDFLEVAPENWIGVSGPWGRKFCQISEKFPLVCHGLSLSIGSPAPLDRRFLSDLKSFLDDHGVLAYTEHLSYCSDEQGHLYDLMPLPFTEETVQYVAGRIRQVQDLLERRIGIENVSCYATPSRQLTELEFINGVLAEADCDLLLDVNNIYVNSVNFQYDPHQFLVGIDGARAVYLHVAGHVTKAPELLLDTHGTAVIEPVWKLLDEAFDRLGPLPTVLERDFNFPPFADLLAEVERIRAIGARYECAVPASRMEAAS